MVVIWQEAPVLTHSFYKTKPLRGPEPHIVEEPEQSEILTGSGSLDFLDT